MVIIGENFKGVAVYLDCATVFRNNLILLHTGQNDRILFLGTVCIFTCLYVDFCEQIFLCMIAGQCLHNGQTYSVGETFPDDCNTCQCRGGNVRCTKILCSQNGKQAVILNLFRICTVHVPMKAIDLHTLALFSLPF